MTAQRIAELEQLVERLDRQLTEQRTQQRVLQTQLTNAVGNAQHWRKRFDMMKGGISASAIMFEPSSETAAGLLREATMRFVKPDALVKKLIETVVKDKLFSAVLDQ